MISQKSKYALKALTVLAREYRKGPVQIVEIAEQENISRNFLELILLELKNQGLLHSRKGRRGGYSLAKPPEAISVGQVLRMTGGPLALLPCVSKSAYRRCEECHDERTCGIRMVMKEVRDATAKILDTTMLADLVKRGQVAALGREALEFSI